MSHRELCSIQASDFWINPDVIRPVLVLLEQQAAKIADTYQRLAALCPAAAAPRPAPPLAAVATPPLNHTKIAPAPAKTTPRPTALPLDVARLAAKTTRGKRDGRILALVTKSKGLTCTELASACGVTVPTLYSAAQRLVRDGQLTCGGDKRYRPVVAPADAAPVN